MRIFLVCLMGFVFFLSFAQAGSRPKAKDEPGWIIPHPEVKSRKVPLEISDPTGVERKHWMVRGGVPIPGGELTSPENVRILDSQNKEVPCQARALAYWPAVNRNGYKVPQSVMWLLLTFPANIPEGGTAAYSLEYGTRVHPAAKCEFSVKVERKGGEVKISNGLISLELEPTAHFIKSIKVGEKTVVRDGGVYMRLDKSYKDGTMDWMPVVRVPFLSRAPVIDGKLDDEAWRAARAVELRPFRLRSVSQTTRAYLGLDEKYLYIAFDCADDDVVGIKSPARPRDHLEIRQDDRIEVWLDPAYADEKTRPGEDSFLGISLSASGSIRDKLVWYQASVDKWDPEVSQKAVKVDGRPFVHGPELDIKGMKTAVSKSKRGWQAELAIPLDEARLNWTWKGKAKSSWSRFTLYDEKRHQNTFGISLYRFRTARPGKSGGEELRWPYSLSYSDVRPAKFARVPDPSSKTKDDDPLASSRIPTKTIDARIEVKEIAVEEEGPLACVVRVGGNYLFKEHMPSPFTVRFHLYADRAILRCFHTMTTGFQTYRARLAGVGLELPGDVIGKITCGTLDGEAVEREAAQPVECVQYRDDSFAIWQANLGLTILGGRLSGWMQAELSGEPVTLAARYFWQLYPGGLAASPKYLRIDFWSPRAQPLYFGTTGDCREDYGGFDKEPHDGPQRVSRTHEVWLNFEGTAPASFSRSVKALPLPTASAKWNCQSRAMGWIAPYDRKIAPAVEDFNDYSLWWWVNEQQVRRWYGWADYGNILNAFCGRGPHRLDPEAYERGYVRQGGYGWKNDRKCITLAYLLQYFRSGRRVWFDFGEGMARSSTDICTSYPVPSDGENVICRPRRHPQLVWGSAMGSAARQGGQPGWVLYYLLTGDGRVRDVIYAHAQHIIGKPVNPWTGGGMDTSSPHGTRGMEYRHLMNLWEITGEERYQKAIEGFQRFIFHKRTPDGGIVYNIQYPWADPRPENVRMNRQEPGGPFEAGLPGTFFFELGWWSSLVRYYDLTGDPEMRASCTELAYGEINHEKRARREGYSIFNHAYSRPTPMFVDMYRWTRDGKFLVRLVGKATEEEVLADENPWKSPAPPASPEEPISEQELYGLGIRFGKLPEGRFPADYLWPSGTVYRPYALYILQDIAQRHGKAER